MKRPFYQRSHLTMCRNYKTLFPMLFPHRFCLSYLFLRLILFSHFSIKKLSLSSGKPRNFNTLSIDRKIIFCYAIYTNQVHRIRFPVLQFVLGQESKIPEARNLGLDKSGLTR